MIVTVADSATAALDYVPSAQLLLADIAMPGEDGYSLIRRVRALPAEQGGRVPAVALTAYAGERDRELALEAGFDRHIAKPVEHAQLFETIADLMRMAITPPPEQA
jgi:CheY-like chemotaxis protein